MLSGGAERYLVRAETSSLDAVSLDAVSAALHAETAEVASSRNLCRHSHSHSRHRLRRASLSFWESGGGPAFSLSKHKTCASELGSPAKDLYELGTRRLLGEGRLGDTAGGYLS
jgi:hypothetical protein